MELSSDDDQGKLLDDADIADWSASNPEMRSSELVRRDEDDEARQLELAIELSETHHR